MTFDRDTGVEELLRKEFRKFHPLPDVVHQGLSAAALPPDVIPTGIGGAEMTVSIAASDASDRSKEKADFVAVATSDDRIIHETALDSIDWNGKVVLSEGTHTFDSQLLRASGGGNVLFEGMGQDQTTITGSVAFSSLFNSSTAINWAWKDLTLSGADLVTNSLNWGLADKGSYKMYRVVVRDFTGDGVSIGRAAGTGRFVDCIFTSNTGRGFFQRESHCHFFHCQFTSNGGDGLRQDQSSRLHIQNCHFENNGGSGIAQGNALSGGSSSHYVTNNVFRNNGTSAIDVGSGDNWHIVGNWFAGHTNSMAFGAGGFGNSSGHWITGNLSTDSVFVSWDGDGTPMRFGVNSVGGIVEIGDGIPVTGHPARVQVTNTSKEGTLATGTGTIKIPWTVTGTIVDVTLAVGTSPVGQDLIVDIHKNGTTIFTVQGDRPIVADGDADGIGAAAQPQVNAMAVGDYLTIDIDQVGSPATEGEDLVVAIEWIAD